MWTNNARLRLLVEHTDVLDRIDLIPSVTQVRGVVYKGIEAALRRVNKFDEYSEFHPQRVNATGLYPLRDFMVSLAAAGAIHAGPKSAHEGMREIGRENARVTGSSLLGRVLLRGLSRDPVKLLKQGATTRRLTNPYGAWRLELTSERSAVIHMETEYCWMDSYFVGAALGTFDTLGKAVSVTCELDSRFDGRHLLAW